jgi:hypothetical protein
VKEKGETDQTMTYAKNHDTHDLYIDDVPNEAGKDQITRKKQQLHKQLSS